jgi:hypothetical protein
MTLHYGGVVAYRIEHGSEPEMSKDFAACVRRMARLG